MERLRRIQIIWPGAFALLCMYVVFLQPFGLAVAVSGVYFGFHALIAAVAFRHSLLARRACLVMTTLNLVVYSAVLFYFLYLQVESGELVRDPLVTVFVLAVLGIGMVLPAVISVYLYLKHRETFSSKGKTRESAVT